MRTGFDVSIHSISAFAVASGRNLGAPHGPRWSRGCKPAAGADLAVSLQAPGRAEPEESLRSIRAVVSNAGKVPSDRYRVELELRAEGKRGGGKSQVSDVDGIECAP